MKLGSFKSDKVKKKIKNKTIKQTNNKWTETKQIKTACHLQNSDWLLRIPLNRIKRCKPYYNTIDSECGSY